MYLNINGIEETGESESDRGKMRKGMSFGLKMLDSSESGRIGFKQDKRHFFHLMVRKLARMFWVRSFNGRVY